MATYSEIVEMRKSGNYLAAYDMAMAVKAEDPGCLWVNNQIGWCLFEILKANASIHKSVEFVQRLQEFADLNKERPLDGFILKSIVWPIRTFVASCCNEQALQENPLYQVFGVMQQIPFDATDENYGILLGAFVKAKKWGGLKQFIEWWNLDNIKEKDCQPYVTPDGVKIMPIAEQAYIAYSNILLDEIDRKVANEESVKSYVERLTQVNSWRPEFQYTNYYRAKLLLGIGRNEEAIAALMPFVKKKAKDYWVWDLLGDAETDEDLRMSCYCKALSCSGKEQFLRKLHLKLCDLLLKKGLYDEARVELNTAITISNDNGWAIPLKYQDYTTESWYQSAKGNGTNTEFYKSNSQAAEQLAYSDYPQIAIVVVYINKEKQIANFVSTEHKTGFFSCRGLNCKVGGTYICQMENDNGNHHKIYTCMPTDGEKLGLIKSFSGKLSVKMGGYGLVNDVFVPVSITQNYENGAYITGLALPSYDEKKGKWGWKAYQITTKNKQEAAINT